MSTKYFLSVENNLGFSIRKSYIVLGTENIFSKSAKNIIFPKENGTDQDELENCLI